MHYNINDIVIRTDNSARSHSQPSRYLLDYIQNINPAINILDFGCGKLRYSMALHKKCKVLTIVDSEIQLEKEQMIHNKKTTIRKFSKEFMHNCRVLSWEEFQVDNTLYDFALCANVLSAIPCEFTRTSIIKMLKNSLAQNGICLFANQYTNSFFTKLKSKEATIKHLDGWITISLGKHYYFGVIGRSKMKHLVDQNGMKVVESWNEGQSAYVLACSP